MNRIFVLLAFLFPLLVACQQDKSSADFYERLPEERVAKMVREIPEAKAQSSAGIGFGSGNSSGGSPSVSNKDMKCDAADPSNQKMLIKKASVRFEVKDYQVVRRTIGDIVGEFDAYISSEAESKTEYQVSNQMAIRISSVQFEALIDSLLGQAKNLDEKNITVEDVTEEFVDVKARLKAKRQVEERYLEILKKANSVTDILEVEKKLGQIREEIETAEGRLKYLSHQVAYSTIDLYFYEQKTVFPKTRTGFLSQLASSFMNGWSGLTEFILGLISIWPFLLIITGIVFLIYKLIQRLQKRRNAPDL
jgi:hypothetical protein